MDKVNWLIAGIDAKDVQDIVDKQTYIPTLNKVNNVSQVTNWLNKRRDVLVDVRDKYTEAQVIAFMDNYYNNLTTEQQAQADLIMAGEEVENQSEQDWEDTVLFRIYYFITTE